MNSILPAFTLKNLVKANLKVAKKTLKLSQTFYVILEG